MTDQSLSVLKIPSPLYLQQVSGMNQPRTKKTPVHWKGHTYPYFATSMNLCFMHGPRHLFLSPNCCHLFSAKQENISRTYLLELPPREENAQLCDDGSKVVP